MDIGILGTGAVGSALAAASSAQGHEIILGSRTPTETTSESYPVRSHAATIAAADLLILAVPATAAIDIAADHRTELAGVTVVDPTNEYPHPHDDRAVAERIATTAEEATVVKGFNTIGANRMTDPVIDGEAVSMFIAGDDTTATQRVGSFAADLGFDPVIAGELNKARRLEEVARFWIDLSADYGRDIGFQLRRE